MIYPAPWVCFWKNKNKQSLKLLARIYICTTYFYMILYQPYFCSAFQIKYIDPTKAWPLKWAVCNLRIYFWFEKKMVECSCYVILKMNQMFIFQIKPFVLCIICIERIYCSIKLIYICLVAQLGHRIHLCFHLVHSDEKWKKVSQIGSVCPTTFFI